MKTMVFLLENLATPEDVYASVPQSILSEDVRILLELGIGVQTDRTVHMVLLMQDIAEKHGRFRGNGTALKLPCPENKRGFATSGEQYVRFLPVLGAKSSL